jgi:Protein of unknown function (DUF667)
MFYNLLTSTGRSPIDSWLSQGSSSSSSGVSRFFCSLCKSYVYHLQSSSRRDFIEYNISLDSQQTKSKFVLFQINLPKTLLVAPSFTFEFVCADLLGNKINVSLSSLFRQTTVKDNRNIQVPLKVVNYEYHADLWINLVVDLNHIVLYGSKQKFCKLLSLKVCGNLNLRRVVAFNDEVDVGIDLRKIVADKKKQSPETVGITLAPLPAAVDFLPSVKKMTVTVGFGENKVNLEIPPEEGNKALDSARRTARPQTVPVSKGNSLVPPLKSLTALQEELDREETARSARSALETIRKVSKSPRTLIVTSPSLKLASARVHPKASILEGNTPRKIPAKIHVSEARIRPSSSRGLTQILQPKTPTRSSITAIFQSPSPVKQGELRASTVALDAYFDRLFDPTEEKSKAKESSTTQYEENSMVHHDQENTALPNVLIEEKTRDVSPESPIHSLRLRVENLLEHFRKPFSFKEGDSESQNAETGDEKMLLRFNGLLYDPTTDRYL